MAEVYGESPLAARIAMLAQHSAPNTVHLAETPFRAQITLRVDPRSSAAERIGTALGVMLPNQPRSVVKTRDLLILRLRHDEWLLVGTERSATTIQRTLAKAVGGDHAAVVDVSAHRTILDVSGPKARELLNKGCALDLHPRSFDAGQCAQTTLARAEVILLCRAVALPSYWAIVRSSFARHLADWLVDAASEYCAPGISPQSTAVQEKLSRQ